MKKHLLCAMALAGSICCAENTPAQVPSVKVLPKIYLWPDENIRTAIDRPSITPMLIECAEPRPAVLVIPGGGYGSVCESTEGSPIARKFNELGYHALVLDYRTAPNRFPAPQQDAMRAIKMIRSHAGEWQIDPSRVYVCGFSAGGHLAASLGTLCDDVDVSAGDEADRYSARPDAMILCYGVLAFEEWSHEGTQSNLLGENYAAIRHEYSTVQKITANTPPAFLMHTIQDQVVNFRNSVEFAQAMAKAGVPCRLELYNWGDHGMLLGSNTEVASWPYQAYMFLEELERAKKDPAFRSYYTNYYQSKHLK